MWILLLFLPLLAGCDLQPRGSIVFEIEGKTEFDKAFLAFPPSAERRDPIKLRWADTNVFMTTATLAPGRYHFSARSSDGHYYGNEMSIESGKKRYKLPGKSAGTVAVAAGPPVKGTLLLTRNELPRELVVIFLGHDVVLRRVPVTKEGTFTAESPAKGKYRVEVHALGTPLRSFSRDGVDTAAPVDLGVIALRSSTP